MDYIRFFNTTGISIPRATKSQIIDRIHKEVAYLTNLLPSFVRTRKRVTQSNFALVQEITGCDMIILTRRKDNYTRKLSEIEIVVLPANLVDLFLIRDRSCPWKTNPAIKEHLIAHGDYSFQAC